MAISSSDFQTILKYPFSDKLWFSRLCLQGGLLLFLTFFLIGIPFLTGYMIRCTQKAMRGEVGLPSWSEWGLFWKLGWKTLWVGLVYSSPLVLAWLVGGGIAVGGFVLAEYENEFEPLIAISIGILVLLYGLTFLFSITMWFVQPAYIPLLAQGKTTRECLALRRHIWPYVKENFVNILIIVAIIYLSGLVAALGLVFFGIGYFLTFPYSLAVTGYAYGLVYRTWTKSLP